MSYNSYYGYPNSYYNYSSSYSPRSSSPYVRPISGLELDSKKRRQRQKQQCLIATVVVLLLLLIGALIAVIWLYLKTPQTPVDSGSTNATTTTPNPDAGFLPASVLATRTDLTYGSEYADPNQNAYQSLEQTACYQISVTASSANYVVTECIVKGMSAGQPTGVNIDMSLRVFIQSQTPEDAIVGLATALSGIENPWVIDKNNVKQV